ncbi:hypothetical protein HNY73_001564 [Argiope bruennichi]|uniref:Uncharacterized protein n=1 Tax=Argiope bruennichi TaxID=94029 RepID=A0A8T0G5W3_ARGBR|nr:hypothetical protein HNY73_001564 [Argiope bruennichi]
MKKLKKLGNFPVETSPHKSLKYSCGIISEKDLSANTEHERVQEQSCYRVIAVRRIHTKRDSVTMPTQHVVLTFSTPDLPKAYELVIYIVHPPRLPDSSKREVSNKILKLTISSSDLSDVEMDHSAIISDAVIAFLKCPGFHENVLWEHNSSKQMCSSGALPTSFFFLLPICLRILKGTKLISSPRQGGCHIKGLVSHGCQSNRNSPWRIGERETNFKREILLCLDKLRSAYERMIAVIEVVVLFSAGEA